MKRIIMRYVTILPFSNLSYKKIDSKLNFPDSRIAGTAYIENNFIVLNVIIKASSPSGELLSFYITDEKYIPRIPVCGTYAAHMSGLDAGKFNSALINSSGKGDIYLNEQMTYGELVTFVYPCRSKSDSFADI